MPFTRRSEFLWRLHTRSLALGTRTLVMGVLNVTPDSFSDGGLYHDANDAIQHGLRMLDEGVDIVDIGGESTRPGQKERLTDTAEQERVLPVLAAILKARPDAVISMTHIRLRPRRLLLKQGRKS